MIVIDGLIDLVVDYNLILFVADVLENTVIVATLGFSHEVFAVLNGPKENTKS